MKEEETVFGGVARRKKSLVVIMSLVLINDVHYDDLFNSCTFAKHSGVTTFSRNDKTSNGDLLSDFDLS